MPSYDAAEAEIAVVVVVVAVDDDDDESNNARWSSSLSALDEKGVGDI